MLYLSLNIFNLSAIRITLNCIYRKKVFISIVNVILWKNLLRMYRQVLEGHCCKCLVVWREFANGSCHLKVNLLSWKLCKDILRELYSHFVGRYRMRYRARTRPRECDKLTSIKAVQATKHFNAGCIVHEFGHFATNFPPSSVCAPGSFVNCYS